jgi:carboxypeptidase T
LPTPFYISKIEWPIKNDLFVITEDYMRQPKVALTTLLFLIFSFSLLAKNVRFIHLEIKDPKVINRLASMIHIDQIIENSVYAVVNDDDYKSIKKVFSKYIKEDHILTSYNPQTLSDEFEYPPGDEAFRTYPEVKSELNEYGKNFSKIAEVIEVGQTINGRPIMGLHVTGVKKRKKDSFIPGILFVGSHHAREHLSTEVPMNLIKHLLESYGKDQRITQLINSRDLYFIPMLNSDGSLHDIKGRKYKYWRKNRVNNQDGSFGVDLNRNYSFGWGTGGSSRRTRSDVYMGPKPFSEPETQAIKQFIENHANIRILLSFHTYSELILYPWGGKRGPVGGKDQLVFEKMAKTMSKWNGYKPQKASDLYIASGDTCDWAYGEHGIFCFTFELSPKNAWNGGFYPGASVIERTTKVNIEPALYLIDKAAAPYSVLKN